MPKPDLQKQSVEDDAEETSLKGTLISVLLLGGFLIISWFGVWYLFISR